MNVPRFTIYEYLRLFEHSKVPNWSTIYGRDLYQLVKDGYVKLPDVPLEDIDIRRKYSFTNPEAFITFRGIWAHYLWTHQPLLSEEAKFLFDYCLSSS